MAYSPESLFRRNQCHDTTSVIVVTRLPELIFNLYVPAFVALRLKVATPLLNVAMTGPERVSPATENAEQSH